MLCGNTIKVRLVGALAATFLLREESETKWVKNAKEDGSQKRAEVGGTAEMAVPK